MLIRSVNMRRRAAAAAEVISYLVSSYGALTSQSVGSQEGWEFKANSAFTLKGLRSLDGSAGSRTMRLWRVSDQALLATATNPSVTALAWNDALFTSPVTLVAGQNYIITQQESANASRSIRQAEVSTVTFSALATYVITRNTSGTGFPSNAPNPVYYRGMVDGIVVS